MFKDDDMKDVERGAEFLDRHDPGWLDRIHVESLRVSSSQLCVFGQLYGGYDNGIQRYSLSSLETRRFGLSRDGDSQYIPLTRAWKKYIHERRATCDRLTEAAGRRAAALS